MNNLKKVKLKEYAKEDVAFSYNKHRFSGKSGEFVNYVELNTLSRFVSNCNLILDLACGTGRFTFHLIKMKKKVISLDSSPAMLKEAKKRSKGIFILGDMFYLPFKKNYFDGVVIGRVFQHFNDLSPLLKEIKRVVKPKGIVAFDTLLWSPRSFHRLFNKNHPKAVYGHSIIEIKKILKKENLKVLKYQSRFLLPPGIYCKLPFWIIRILNFIELFIPRILRVRTFWKVTKPLV